MNALQRLMQKLRLATPRERAGLALIVAVSVLIAALSTFDWALNAQQRAREADRLRAEVEAAHAGAADAGYQESLALSANKVWRWSVVENSEALARAQANTAFEALALGAGLGNVAVNVVDDDGLEASQKVSAIALTLSANFDWASFLAFLQALQASDISFSVEAIEVAAALEQTPSFTLRARAPFLHEAPP
jgi:hypothetical protein